ncbi:MAG: hypothetical protein K2I68_06000 [Bacteroidales bacterium]|nr:hypothetical protein [Bacteroidales bacterium]
MKRYLPILPILLCTAATAAFIACFEAHFANEEGKYLFVYTADLLKRFWPFGEWHYPGAPANGSGALFLHTFFTQFYHATVGIYAVLLAAFGLWLFGGYLYSRRAGIPTLYRCAVVYPLATALFLFVSVSPKFPTGLLWGLLVALWLCIACGGKKRACLWGAWLAGAFLFVGMGFFPFLFFVAGFSGLYWTQPKIWIDIKQSSVHVRTAYGLRKILWFSVLLLLWIPLPFAWAAISRQPLAVACDAYTIINWRQNGISKDWKLYLSYQKTWRAIRQGDYREALKQADRYWFSERADYRPDLSPGEQYFRRHLAECTKLALLVSGELNNRFLMYGTQPEMATLFLVPTPMMSYYDPIYQRFYWETGALTAAAYEGINIIEREGLRADVLPLLALTQVCLHQHGLAEKYLYLLRHTLFYRKQAKYIDPAIVLRKRAEIDPKPSGLYGKEPRAEMAHIMAVHPKNFYVAEYMLMQYLLEKNLKDAWKTLKHYRALGYKGHELPIYAQEAMLLYIQYGLNQAAFTIAEEGLDGLKDFRFNPAVTKRFENYLQEKWNFETGRLRPEAFFDKYANSYAFFYMYLKNIDPEELAENDERSNRTQSLVH